MRVDRRSLVRLAAEPVALLVSSLAVFGPLLYALDSGGRVSAAAGAGVVVGTVALGVGIVHSGRLPTVARERSTLPDDADPAISAWRRSLVTRGGLVFGLLAGVCLGFVLDAVLVALSPAVPPTSVRLFLVAAVSLSASWLGVRATEQFTPALPDDRVRPLDD